MIILLPPREKQELKNEITLRKILTIFSCQLVCLLGFIAFLGIFNSSFASKSQDLQKTIAQEEAKLQSVKFQEFKDKTTELNKQLKNLQAFWQKQVSVSEGLAKFSSLLPPNFFLDDVSFRLSSVQTKSSTSLAPALFFGELSLSGIAVSREALYEFKKILESQKELVSVYFTPSSWAKSENPIFSLTFSFIPQKDK